MNSDRRVDSAAVRVPLGSPQPTSWVNFSSSARLFSHLTLPLLSFVSLSSAKWSWLKTLKTIVSGLTCAYALAAGYLVDSRNATGACIKRPSIRLIRHLKEAHMCFQSYVSSETSISNLSLGIRDFNKPGIQIATSRLFGLDQEYQGKGT